MSRTSIKERNKAIRLAWEREQQLVQEGKGTRNWTKEQQKDILNPDKGKAYDENGRAFEGQHMKSAAEYPEYQGNPDNIQFLTREEHLEAHRGSWQNPTNWYYNPESKEFIDFGENNFVPCDIINLIDPIVKSSEAVQESPESAETSPEEEKEKGPVEEEQKDSPTPEKPSASESYASRPSPKVSKSLGEKVIDAYDAIKEFGENHPVLTGVLKVVGVVATAVGAEMIANSGKGSSDGSNSSSENGSFFNASDDSFTDSLDADDYDDTSFSTSDEDNTDPMDSDDYDKSSSERNYPDERSSPEKHTVSAHGQHYHTNEGLVWREKEAYPRGGKHDDD